ncbi:uncharacterized protein AKAW2_10079A [Aspergillus luchuensis]|uniref:Uncharacterized protein n=1 Tax=Aspergillus kawachii TaxID=1069201 RepID=A0A7R7WMK4_ASPKA|nr:uncharacterized protein AKAW2_10079A [Aspergillus luchuensis]BCR93033.1 hypothetical protein AKAW2_10079A [Aspergillus luchuensis]BCS05691.1 hypothetical protein ALUC_10072A [Aspergillus luchuensis]
MAGDGQSNYDAVPVEEQATYQDSPSRPSSLQYEESTVDHPEDTEADPKGPRLQPLETSLLYRLLRLVFDIIVASISLLFVILGVWAYKIDGNLAGPDSTGSKLVKVAQYAPTIFPVLFAAIVGGSMKSIPSWCIQTHRGATVGLLQRCLGSQSISGAVLTQIQLGLFDFGAIMMVLLWSLSPLGSQASLRVISIVARDSSNLRNLTTINTFIGYQYGNAEGIAEAQRTVVYPTVAAIMAASLLEKRNQDLWGNVRFPMLENEQSLIDTTGHEWTAMPEGNNLTYASLVGTPVGNLADAGNTSFTLPGSYLYINCSKFGKSNQTGFTNYTSSSSPLPETGVDCTWASMRGGTQYQIAISQPCSNFRLLPEANTTRPSRQLQFESRVQATSMAEWTRAECDLTTTYIDANVTCTASASGSSSASTCQVSSVRASPEPPYDRNWTVFDLNEPFSSQPVLSLLSTFFPNAQVAGGDQPILAYLEDPYHAVVNPGSLQGTYTAGKKAFETRLAQILNSVLYIGINPSAFTGSFAEEEALAAKVVQENTVIPMSQPVPGASTTLVHEVVQCSRSWLGVLLAASLALFLCAIAGAILRFCTLAPDVLGSIAVAFLRNRIPDLAGSSTWSADEWVRHTRDTRLYLGDVEAEAEAGCIALATSPEDVQVPLVKNRLYM